MVTDSKGGDPDHFPEVLDQVEDAINKVGADGAYDSLVNSARVAKRGAVPIIPVRLGAVTHPEAQATARNAVVSEMNRLWEEKSGDATWKRESGYRARSRVESEMFRYKQVIGDSVSFIDSRSQANEALLGCQILNRFLSLGRCESYAIVSVANPVT